MQLAFDLQALDQASEVGPQEAPGTAPAVPLALADIVLYRAFTANDTTVEEAAAAFLRRYGCAAAEVRPALGGLLLAGPIPERG
jgi:hypothetical protein